MAAKLRGVKRNERLLHLKRRKAFRSGEQGKFHRSVEGKLGRERSLLFTKRGQKRSRRESKRVVAPSAPSFEAKRVTDLSEVRQHIDRGTIRLGA